MEEEIITGTRFYYINEYGTFLKKIVWKNEYYFEWLGGWSLIKNLKPNPNKKSKVKLIFDQNEQNN